MAILMKTPWQGDNEVLGPQPFYLGWTVINTFTWGHRRMVDLQAGGVGPLEFDTASISKRIDLATENIAKHLRRGSVPEVEIAFLDPTPLNEDGTPVFSLKFTNLVFESQDWALNDDDFTLEPALECVTFRFERVDGKTILPNFASKGGWTVPIESDWNFNQLSQKGN